MRPPGLSRQEWKEFQKELERHGILKETKPTWREILFVPGEYSIRGWATHVLFVTWCLAVWIGGAYLAIGLIWFTIIGLFTGDWSELTGS